MCVNELSPRKKEDVLMPLKTAANGKQAGAQPKMAPAAEVWYFLVSERLAWQPQHYPGPFGDAISYV